MKKKAFQEYPFGDPKKLHQVHIDCEWFKDEFGRTLIFRGSNLPAKEPIPGTTSFVNRPFPLTEADEHFARLKYWGFTLLRLSVTWEAVSHKGPNLYDEEYINYLKEFVHKAGQFGLHVLIDFHQDVWSRATGGDGAPLWTLEMAGFNLSHLEETGACILHNPQKRGHHLLWSTNSYKLGAATMFTLFFGGNVFAPKLNLQETLQSHYLEMMAYVARNLTPFDNVIGYEVMNEPLKGYIGCKHIDRPFGLFQLEESPTPLESMALGDGFSLEVDLFKKKMLRIKKMGRVKLNPKLLRAWAEGSPCIWRSHGVWDVDDRGEPKILKPSYFSKVGERDVHFEADFYKPFLQKAKKRLQDTDGGTMVFIENVVGSKPPHFSPEETQNLVFAGHWYDAFVLVTKKFLPFIGFDLFKMEKVIALPKRIRKSFASQIGQFKHFAKEKMGGVPTFISEFGIPLDLDEKKAYQTGDFQSQNKALNRSFTALDDNLVSSTIWNYTSSNSNLLGDQWNSEDLSIFSKDQHFDPNDPYSGARAKEALIRPYTKKTAGTPVYMHFNNEIGLFEYLFKHDPKVNEPTEIFLPHLHFKKPPLIQVSDGSYAYDSENQTLYYTHTLAQPLHYVKVRSVK